MPRCQPRTLPTSPTASSALSLCFPSGLKGVSRDRSARKRQRFNPAGDFLEGSVIIYFRDKETGVVPSAGLLPRCQQQLGLGQVEARNQKFHLGCPLEW